PQTAADAVANRAAFVKRRTREADARLDRPHPAPRQRTVRQLGLARATFVLNVTGNIQATGPPVASDILPEIRQLQSRAERVRRSIQCLVVVAGDPPDQTADRIRRSPAVVEHVTPRGV